MITKERQLKQQLTDKNVVLEAILENVDQGIVMYDEQYRLQAWNRQWADILDLDPEFLAGRPLLEDIIRDEVERGIDHNLPGDIEDKVGYWMERVRSATGPYLAEQTFPDGRYVELWTNPLPYGGLVRTLSDVTARKRIERTLRDSEERYAMAMEGANEGLWDWDVAADEIFISERFGTLMGLKTGGNRIMPSEWLGRMHADDSDHYRACLLAHLRGETGMFDAEFRVLGDDDAYRWVWAHGCARRDVAGRVYRMAGSLDDVTSRKQAEAELLEAKRLADEAHRQVTEKNLMLEGLSAKLSKYLAPQVYSSIFTGKQSVEVATRRKKLTVCFTDIANFTEITDSLAHEDLTTLLNDFLTEMSRIAHSYGATIDKFIGDSIMLFFGDPESCGVENDAIACVKMALAMQQRMCELQGRWQSIGVETPVQLRVGISTGYCAVGNFGSEDRIDYTIIGSEVNLASRLQTHADLGGILIACETYSLVQHSILAEEQSPITVKGIARPVRTYKVTGIYDELEAQGQIIHTELEGIKVFVDLNRNDNETAIHAIDDVLQKLKANQVSSNGSQ